jgi:hypothetical protein
MAGPFARCTSGATKWRICRLEGQNPKGRLSTLCRFPSASVIEIAFGQMRLLPGL